MKKISPENIRAVAVVGHGHAGKTTLVESALVQAGAVPRPGRVEDGTAHTDTDAEEHARKISIQAMPASFSWNAAELNVIDCPGYVDFMSETRAAMNAVDSALLVVAAPSGSEAQTEKVVEFAHELKLPLIAWVTKMDREGADFDRALASLNEATDSKFVPYWLPIGQADSFAGHIDVFHGKAFYATDELGGYEERPIPDAMRSAVAAAHDKLVEAAVEVDDALTEKYLAGAEIDDADLRRGMEEGMAAGKFVPVFCGSSTRNVGVKQLLDALVAYAPTPPERVRTALTTDGVEEMYTPSESGQVLAHCFKVLHEPHVGDVALVRVLNGTLTPGMHVLNVNSGLDEKVGAMFRLIGAVRREASELTAGEIGALVKLHGIQPGASLASKSHPLMHPVSVYPEPTMSYAIRPATLSDGEKLSNILSKLGHEDPAVKASSDPVTHEITFAGPGDVALDVFVHRLKVRHHIAVSVAKPRIPYQETVRGHAEAEGKLKKQSGGHGQFAIANLRVEPNPGGGFEFIDAVVGGSVPRNFIPAVEKGLREALPRGVIAGYPVTDVRVTLVSGKHHDVDSSEQAFKTAASIGFREAVKAAHPVLLEPVMEVQIIGPTGSLGGILGDLSGRRGKVVGMEPAGRKTTIRALVPLAEMYCYIKNLRSMTGGRGEFEMSLHHYDELPSELAMPILAEWAQHHAHTDAAEH